MEIILCDRNTDLIKAWHSFFDRGGHATITQGDVLKSDTSALVLPTNSFGIMGGGLAEQINKLTEGELETRARKLILEKYAGELPVGCAEIMSSGLEHPVFLVLAPTSRVPSRQSGPSINPYLSTRAALRTVARFIRESRTRKEPVQIDKIALVGMGTGQGGCAPGIAAFQMYEAYCQIVLGQVPNFATLEAASAHDQELRKNRYI
jgi:O-acetyl-ADP-ribose deacetylase (regulator of RNase III)